MKIPIPAACARLALPLPLLLLLVAPLLSAPQAPAVARREGAAERIVALARGDNRVQDHLRTLTRRYGPRLTGSHVLYDAQVWARDTFASYGLEARLERWGEFPVGFHRGPTVGRVVSPRERELEFITGCWTAGTLGPVEGAAVLEPETFEELEALRARLGGAWVLKARRGRDERRAWAERLAGGDEEKDGTRLVQELEDGFAAACAEAGVAGTVRSGPADGLLVTSGNYRVDPENLPSAVAITLRGDQFAAIVEELRAGADVRLMFDIDNRFVPGPIDLYNVVADLKGSEFPDEYVIVQAHVDAWDGAQGACDNGTGTATTLEAARLLVAAGVVPRRTIRFVLYGGEEQGLLGSDAYCEAHADELERVSIVLNHDNGPNPLEGIAATAAMLADFEAVFAPVEGLDPERPFEIREVGGISAGGGSDHASFVRRGVPAFFWMQSQEGYQHVHHTQFDTFEYAGEQDQKHNALVVALAAYGFAQLDHLVDRTNMSPPPPRLLGVQLEGARVVHLTAGAKAALAGWQVGDVILAIDGVKIEGSQNRVRRELARGGPRKAIRLQRGDEVLESSLDYSDDPDEPRRRQQAAEREERLRRREAERAARREGDGG